MKVRGWFSAIRRRAAAVLVAGVLAIPLVSLEESVAFPCWNYLIHLNSTYGCQSGSCYIGGGPGFAERYCGETSFGYTWCSQVYASVPDASYTYSGCTGSKCPDIPFQYCKPVSHVQPRGVLAPSCTVNLVQACGWA